MKNGTGGILAQEQVGFNAAVSQIYHFIGYKMEKNGTNTPWNMHYLRYFYGAKIETRLSKDWVQMG